MYILVNEKSFYKAVNKELAKQGKQGRLRFSDLKNFGGLLYATTLKKGEIKPGANGELIESTNYGNVKKVFDRALSEVIKNADNVRLRLENSLGAAKVEGYLSEKHVFFVPKRMKKEHDQGGKGEARDLEVEKRQADFGANSETKKRAGDFQEVKRGQAFRAPRDSFDPLEFSNSHPLLSKTPFLGFLCLVVDAFRVGKKVISESSKYGNVLESIKANAHYILPPKKEFLSEKWLERLESGESVVNETTLEKQHKILCHEVRQAVAGLDSFIERLSDKARDYTRDLKYEGKGKGDCIDLMEGCCKDEIVLRNFSNTKFVEINNLCKRLNGLKSKSFARLTLGTEILERIVVLSEELKEQLRGIPWHSNFVRSRIMATTMPLIWGKV
ncbi:hypothetical protein [Helicobacter suis]|uniref:hypothetical protein n=1 Tax=Helicobacter suis TaxID=104628 RepID=UPI0013D4BC2C|nr:hypothetical protein [Helicobacter suis]